MPIVMVEKPLKDKLGDEAVESLIRLINQSQVEQKNNMLEFVEEKFERRLSEEISGVRVEIGRLDNKIEATRADLIKWMFIFWIGQVGVILGMLFAFFKYCLKTLSHDVIARSEERTTKQSPLTIPEIASAKAPHNDRKISN